MPSWVVGFLLGFLLLADSLSTPQPLATCNGLLGVFLWVVTLINYYVKK